MIVTLAYPLDGVGQPDETVDVDDTVGRNLVRDGLARLPDEDVFGDLTVDELHVYAADHGIDLGAAKKKADLADTIRRAERAGIPSSSPITTPAPADVDT